MANEAMQGSTRDLKKNQQSTGTTSLGLLGWRLQAQMGYRTFWETVAHQNLESYFNLKLLKWTTVQKKL